jgi:hypothetical protein
LMKNNSMASLLKKWTYLELNDLHLKKANSDWLANQEARYALKCLLDVYSWMRQKLS